MRVKGSAIVDFVRIIRAERDRDWSRYLEPADNEIVEATVLPSALYPGESFWRISWAVNQEIGKGELENAVLFGRTSAATYLKVYKNLLVPGDPGRTVRKFINVWETFYDVEDGHYQPMSVRQSPHHVEVLAHDYPDMIISEARRPYFYGLAGYFQQIVEHALGKPVESSAEDHGSSFTLTYRWV